MNIFLISPSISGNKIEKSGDFIGPDEILKDVLFGGRKSNITKETRSIYKISIETDKFFLIDKILDHE